MSTTEQQSTGQAIHEVLSQAPFPQKLGISFTRIEPGYAEATLTVQEWMLNSVGITHGGVVFSLADSALAAASNSYGPTALAVHADVSFMQPTSTGAVLTAHATEESRSRKLGHYRVEVVDSNQELIATFRGLVYIKR